MRTQLGAKPLIYPQPVLMIGTYDENGTPDIMNAAWGGVGDDTQIFLCLSPDHKTTENILKNKCFTVSIAVEGYETACDYLGIVSGKKVADKVERSGLHVHKSENINAPIIDELPVCLECKLISYEPEHCHLFGEIIETSIDDSILTEGVIDIQKLKPLIFDIDAHKYFSIGNEKAAAFSIGLQLMQ